MSGLCCTYYFIQRVQYFVGMHKWIQCSDTKVEKEKTQHQHNLCQKCRVSPNFKLSVTRLTRTEEADMHADGEVWPWRRFYLRLRYRGPCLGGLLLATGTKLQTSRMQKDMERKKKKKKKQTKMGAVLKQMHKEKQTNRWMRQKHGRNTHTWSMLQQSMNFKTWRTLAWKVFTATFWNGPFYFRSSVLITDGRSTRDLLKILSLQEVKSAVSRSARRNSVDARQHLPRITEPWVIKACMVSG